MKLALIPIVVAMSILSTSAFAKSMNPVTSTETQILHYLTDVNTISLGNFSARVITLSSFAEPDQSLYLLISQDAGFEPEESNTALFNLSKEIGFGYSLKSVTKVNNNEIQVSVQKQSKTKTVVISINGLSASVK